MRSTRPQSSQADVFCNNISNYPTRFCILTFLMECMSAFSVAAIWWISPSLSTMSTPRSSGYLSGSLSRCALRTVIESGGIAMLWTAFHPRASLFMWNVCAVQRALMLWPSMNAMASHYCCCAIFSTWQWWTRKNAKDTAFILSSCSFAAGAHSSVDTPYIYLSVLVRLEKSKYGPSWMASIDEIVSTTALKNFLGFILQKWGGASWTFCPRCAGHHDSWIRISSLCQGTSVFGRWNHNVFQKRRLIWYFPIKAVFWNQ